MKPTSASAPGRPRSPRLARALAVLFAALLVAGTGLRVLADCASYGLPFTDLGDESGFCGAIAEAYYTGLTNGTTAKTYSPSNAVTRDQMAAFTTRTLDQSLLRGGRRGALDQWWTQTPRYDAFGSLGLSSLGTGGPGLLKSDGADIWVVTEFGLSRVRGSDGAVLQTWGAADDEIGQVSAVVIAMSKVFAVTVGGKSGLGVIEMIDPTKSPGDANSIANVCNVPSGAKAITFDGSRIWTTNPGNGVSIVTPGPTLPWSVTTVTAGFNQPFGAVFDGAHVWVTDFAASTLLELDAAGAILKSVSVGSGPTHPTFDGHNIWVPNSNGNSLAVVRASDGTLLKKFSAGNGDQNGLSKPWSAAFDGQRILVANQNGGLSLFHASDLSPIDHWDTPGVTEPFGVCSDGAGFWVSFNGSSAIGRF